MFLGIGKAVITPPQGTWLAGYENGRAADEVLQDLMLRLFWFQPAADSAPAEAVCLITADLLGFGRVVTDTIRADLAHEFGIAPDAVMLAASHTHCAPQTCENMPDVGGPIVPEYFAELRRLVLEAAREACADLRPSKLRLGRGELAGFAINRRLMVSGESQLAPNPAGDRDDSVSVILYSDEETDELRAVLFHYTCHPTLIGLPAVSGDYPGYALQLVEERLRGVAAGFLPGCFGDVRPNAVFIGGRKFRPATFRDVEEFGGALGEEVVRVAQANIASPVLTPQVAARGLMLNLPLQDGSTRPLALQYIELADDLSIVAMGGEMGIDYGYFVKALGGDRNFLPVAYANGIVGYVCPSYQYEEGGFEPILSCEGYGLSAPFEPENETLIQNAIRQLASPAHA